MKGRAPSYRSAGRARTLFGQYQQPRSIGRIGAGRLAAWLLADGAVVRALTRSTHLSRRFGPRTTLKTMGSAWRRCPFRVL
eukprot:6175426-Pleurochrysis_carterae.AAC.6